MDEHGQPTDDACTPDAAMYYDRVIRKCLADAQAADALDTDEEQIAQAVLNSVSGVSFAPPVPTFFDYTPGNWIVDGSGDLSGVIDFENMGWGLPTDPFPRLALNYFPLCRDGREAFYAGYGRDVEGECREQVRIGCIVYALVYKTQAMLRSDAGMGERAQRAFAACR